MNFGLPENLVKSTSFWFAKPASTLAKEIESLFFDHVNSCSDGGFEAIPYNV